MMSESSAGANHPSDPAAQTHGAGIVVMGNAGGGKSTLIQTIFGGPNSPARGYETTGSGADEYTDQPGLDDLMNVHKVRVWDVEGFHTMDGYSNMIDALTNIKRRCRSHTAAQVHVVWWVTTDRPEQAVREQVLKVFEQMPIFLVVNKCDRKADVVDSVLFNARKACPGHNLFCQLLLEQNMDPCGRYARNAVLHAFLRCQLSREAWGPTSVRAKIVPDVEWKSS